MPDSTTVFVSYTATDLAWAHWIGEVLEAAGLRVTLQDWDSPVGDNFVHWIGHHLAEAHHTIAVYSEQYFASYWCTAEWTAALQRQNLVPVRISAVAPPAVLATRTYIDLFGVDAETARERLLRALRLRPVERIATAGFPGGSTTAARVPHDPIGADLAEVAQYEFVRTLASSAPALQTSPSGKYFAAVDQDRTMRLYDVDNAVALGQIHVGSDDWFPPGMFLVFPRADLCVTGCGGTLRFITVPDCRLLHEVVLHSQITGVGAAEGSDHVVVSLDGSPGLALFSITTLQQVLPTALAPWVTWAERAGGLSSVARSASGDFLIMAAEQRLVHLDLRTYNSTEWHALLPISRIAVSSSGECVATAGKSETGGVYEFWNTWQSDRSVGCVEHSASFPSVAIDSTGSVAAFNDGRAVRLVRHRDQKLLTKVRQPDALVAFTADGSGLITVSNPSVRPPKLRRWEISYLNY